MTWGLSLAGGMGVVLGLLGGLVGCPWWRSVVVTLYAVVFHVQGALPPL